jgi:hypothetical protein
MMETQDKRPAPPYLSFTTLNNFIDGLATHMPTRIDKSLMKSMSGASQAALISAFDYLGLRDGDKPSPALVELANAAGGDRASLWRSLITERYPFLFSEGFDLKRATQGELDERFRDEGISGETIRKCVAFFMAAAQASGIEVSPRFRSIKTRTPRARGSLAASRSRKSKREDKPVDQGRSTRDDETNPSTSVKKISFASGGSAELHVDVNVVSLSRADREALFAWIDAMEDYEKLNGSAELPSDTPII